jgi:dihydroorotate dehydrogenase (fumarate)
VLILAVLKLQLDNPSQVIGPPNCGFDMREEIMGTSPVFDGFGPDNPLVMSAAGLFKNFSAEGAETLFNRAGKVLVGSITPGPKRPGNEGTCECFDNPLYGLNAWGMPNPGSDDAPVYPPGTAGRLLKEKMIFSLAAFSPAGYRDLFVRAWDWGWGVELNFGCPNVRDDGSQHKIFSFDPEVLAETLRLIDGTSYSAIPIGVKLSPYSDPGLLKEVAAVIAGFGSDESQQPLVNYVAVTNTFPNGLGYTSGHKPALSTKQAGAFGGISGEAMKPISLSNAAQFRAALPDDIAVVRVGGVSSGEDLWQSYDVGAIGVQMATAVARFGPVALTNVVQEYADIVG